MREVPGLKAGVGALCTVIVIGASGCSSGASTMAASTYGRASLYRSATATVRLASEDAFERAVKLLLERDDIQITELMEADHRCRAIVGNLEVGVRVIEVDGDRSRLSLLVGGGDDPEANQELADSLMKDICARLGTTCELGADTR